MKQMKKGLIACIVFLLLTTTLSFAANAIVGGIEWHYSVKDDNATIEHSDHETPAISKETSGAITIPSTLDEYPVTSIGEYAFHWCSSLTSITIPEGVISIGIYAFSGCSDLTSIDVSKENITYTSVDGILFDKAMSRVIKYPEGKVGDFVIPEGVTSIGEGAFSDCSGLTRITIPTSVTSIDRSAFNGCSSLTRISIPASVVSMKMSAFLNCSSLEHIDVAEDNKKYASLDGVVFSKTLSDMIMCPVGRAGEFTIPEGVRTVQSGAFSGCSNLTKVKVPASVTSISGYSFDRNSERFIRPSPDAMVSFSGVRIEPVFSKCTRLTHIDVAKDNEIYASVDGVLFDKSLHHVMRCPEGKVGTLTLPASVTSLGYRAFYNCSSLTSLIFKGNVPTQVAKDRFGWGWDGVFCETSPALVIYYHEGTTGWKKPWWNLFSNSNSWHGIETKPLPARARIESSAASTILDGIEWHYTVENGSAIIGRTNQPISTLKSNVQTLAISEKTVGEIVIPTQLGGFPVTAIGTGAFWGCSGLTSLTIPEGITSIGQSAFGYCSGLTSITIPKGVTSIGRRAFEDCLGLTSVTIPEGVTSIGRSVFEDCSGLTRITIPKGVTFIGDFAFSGCFGLTNITIPEGVTFIGWNAFEDCSGLTSVTIPEGVMSIGDFAFAGCSGLTSVTIPEGVTFIGQGVFAFCSRLPSVMIPESGTSTGQSTFRNGSD